MRAVRVLRKEFPQLTIFVDTKTMDTGALEAKLAIEAGGNIMSVMAVAPDETIISAIKEASDLGGEVLADTLGLKDLSRLKELVEMGVHRICLHKGVDEGVFSDFDLIDKLRGSGVKLGVAGGINEESIVKVKGAVDFVMVGRAITKSSDPAAAAKRILKAAGLI